MSKYLVHYLVNGTAIGVWNSSKESFYDEKYPREEAYGKTVLSDSDFKDWDALLDLWDGRTPNVRSRWGSLENDSDDLEIVLSVAKSESER